MKMEAYFTVPFKMGQVVVQVAPDGGVTAINFDLEGVYDENRTASRLGADLDRYFQGKDVEWNLELDLTGITDFTRRVYDQVAGIPYGQISTYGQIAREVGSAGGGRAVGQAMAGNRFPLVVPCHRVVSGNRTIGGFSSGTDLKRYLLNLEGVTL